MLLLYVHSCLVLRGMLNCLSLIICLIFLFFLTCVFIFIFNLFIGGVFYLFSYIFRSFRTCLNEWLFLLHIARYATFPTGLYSFRPRSMVCKNINFKTVSLNVRGIRSFEKWKAVFNWLHKSQADICFLQETYSTLEVVNMWKKQWKDDTFFSQGSCHSKGTMNLVKEHLDFKLISSKIDSLGRYIFLEVDIQDSPFVLLNMCFFQQIIGRT